MVDLAVWNDSLTDEGSIVRIKHMMFSPNEPQYRNQKFPVTAGISFMAPRAATWTFGRARILASIPIYNCQYWGQNASETFYPLTSHCVS
jgi:hypothetical protein